MFYCIKKRYECPYCFFTFNSKKELKIHKRKCLFCEKNEITEIPNILFLKKENIPKSKPPPHK